MTDPGLVEMPYKRDGGCDLCGRHAPLQRVTLRPSDRQRLARVAYVCDAHGDPSGPVLRAPHGTKVPGTTYLRPQTEELF